MDHYFFAYSFCVHAGLPGVKSSSSPFIYVFYFISHDFTYISHSSFISFLLFFPFHFTCILFFSRLISRFQLYFVKFYMHCFSRTSFLFFYLLIPFFPFNITRFLFVKLQIFTFALQNTEIYTYTDKMMIRKRSRDMRKRRRRKREEIDSDGYLQEHVRRRLYKGAYKKEI